MSYKKHTHSQGLHSGPLVKKAWRRESPHQRNLPSKGRTWIATTLEPDLPNKVPDKSVQSGATHALLPMSECK